MKYKTSENVLYTVGVIPFAVTAIFVAETIFRKKTFLYSAIIVGCFFLAIIPPMRNNKVY